MKEISPYYLYFAKGSVLFERSRSTIKLNDAAFNLEKCLKFKKTELAYTLLLSCYSKLDYPDEYERVVLEAIDNGFTRFYSAAGWFYAKCKNKCNKEKSLHFFHEGIHLGDAKSSYDLGILYLTGCKAFDINKKKAVITFLNTNPKPVADTKYYGDMYFLLGTLLAEDKSYSLAKAYFEEAIKHGYLRANYDIALLYKDGLGVEKDPELYLDHLLTYLCDKSALELASVFLSNEYFPSDIEIAKSYLDIAARKGDPVGALLSAAFLCDEEDYDKKLLGKYLNVAFRNGKDEKTMLEIFDIVENCFGGEIRTAIQNFAYKYMDIKRNVVC